MHQAYVNQQALFCNIMKQQTMIGSKVAGILSRIQQVRSKFSIAHAVRLVAVSKTKTVQQIKQAYDVGIRHFGENYVEEIQEKQPKLPLDIKWHFIGHLQSNKIKKLLVPNLQIIESIDRESLAKKIQKQLEKDNRLLNILIQVKTSKQQTKSGVELENLDGLYSFIKNNCPHLKFKGLMTIGEQTDINAFVLMNKLKQEMCIKYALSPQQFQLSMGMSADFETAIEHNSTSVRVGSSIFGQRNYCKK